MSITAEETKEGGRTVMADGKPGEQMDADELRLAQMGKDYVLCPWVGYLKSNVSQATPKNSSDISAPYP